jgi:topoisomerase IA-like protein
MSTTDPHNPDLSFLADLDRAALADEFKRRPYGRHSDALQRLLTLMRSEPYSGHPVFIKVGRFGPYRLARLGEKPGDDIMMLEQSYPDRQTAEWALFRARWRRLFGEEIE